MPRLDPLVPAILAAAIGLLFLAAVVHKLRDVRAFREALAGYRLLPAAWTGPAAVLVVAAEAGIVTGCLFAATRATALAGAAVLLTVYAGAMGINLLRGRDRIDCGCLGFARAERIEWWMVRRNLLLAAAAGVAALPAADRALGALDAVVAVCAAATIAVLYVAHGTLAASRRLLAR